MGERHLQPSQLLDQFYRCQSPEFRSATSTLCHSDSKSALSDSLLSKTPLSLERYAFKRKLIKGGLKNCVELMARATSEIGRDLGGVPKTQPPLRRCGFLCKHLPKEISSLRTQLESCLRAIVDSCGGVKQVPVKMPLFPQQLPSCFALFMFYIVVVNS